MSGIVIILIATLIAGILTPGTSGVAIFTDPKCPLSRGARVLSATHRAISMVQGFIANLAPVACSTPAGRARHPRHTLEACSGSSTGD